MFKDDFIPLSACHDWTNGHELLHSTSAYATVIFSDPSLTFRRSSFYIGPRIFLSQKTDAVVNYRLVPAFITLEFYFASILCLVYPTRLHASPCLLTHAGDEYLNH